MDTLLRQLDRLNLKCHVVDTAEGDAEMRRVFENAVIGAAEREAIYKAAVDVLGIYYDESTLLPELLLRMINHDRKPGQCPSCKD